MAQGFAGNEHLANVRIADEIDEFLIEQGGGVKRIRHLRLDNTEVLCTNVRALGNKVDASNVLLFPLHESRHERLNNRVAGRSDLAVRRPDHVRISLARLKLVEIINRPLPLRHDFRTVRSAVCIGENVESENFTFLDAHDGERFRIVPAVIHKPARMGDMPGVVGIHGNVDRIEEVAGFVNKARESLHVFVGTGNKKFAVMDDLLLILGDDLTKAALWIDDYQDLLILRHLDVSLNEDDSFTVSIITSIW